VETHPKAVYRFGPFEVDGTSGVLLKNGARIKLQEQSCRLLLALLDRSGEVVSRDELRIQLWPEDTFVDFEGSLRAAVRRLREVLDDDAEKPRYIETIPKRGYRSWAVKSGTLCVSRSRRMQPLPWSRVKPLRCTRHPLRATHLPASVFAPGSSFCLCCCYWSLPTCS
jgi:DNA-binding winged helix-turn-helix (wHTH) protein